MILTSMSPDVHEQGAVRGRGRSGSWGGLHVKGPENRSPLGSCELSSPLCQLWAVMPVWTPSGPQKILGKCPLLLSEGFSKAYEHLCVCGVSMPNKVSQPV